MFRRKQYGESQIKRCPWCNATALTKNEQNVPVCLKHKQFLFSDVKCSCGKFVDVRDGKFGAFFICDTCGIKSIAKILEVNTIENITKQEKETKPKKQFEHVNIRNKNEEIFDLISSIKKNKKTEEQIAQQNKIKQEKIPTIYELMMDDGNKAIINQKNETQKKKDDNDKYQKKKNDRETIISSEELDFM